VSIATTITALQTVHASITGITSTPTVIPDNLAPVTLPCVMVWPGPATWNFAAAGLKRQEREYTIRVYVQAIGQGFAGPRDGYNASVALIEAFAAAYQADISLGNKIDTITAMSDSGVLGGGEQMQYGQQEYWGFVYRLMIVEKAS
jgi:hypothetical protein